MKTIRYVGRSTVSVPALGLALEPGETAAVPDDVADELLGRREWEPIDHEIVTVAPAEDVVEIRDSDTGAGADETSSEGEDS